MTVSLAGWRRVAIENGVLLQPPDATEGAILIRHRQPFRSLSMIAQQLQASPVGSSAVKFVGPPRTISTDEGEYGGIIKVGTTSGRERRRTIGVVFGDDWMSTVDGRCATPDRFDIFETMVERVTMSLSLGLGSDRFRRFFYTPPTGWSGFERFRCDVWLAPEFPKNPGTISVFHARPEVETRARKQHHKLLEELGAEYGARRGEPHPIITHNGMTGQSVTYGTADGRHAGNVVFSDSRHLYLLRIETDDANKEANTTAFMECMESVQSVPWPRQDLAGLIHWSD